MTEELFKKNRLEMEKDLGITIEPYTSKEMDFMFEGLKKAFKQTTLTAISVRMGEKR